MRIYANAKNWEDKANRDWYTELSLEPIFENSLFLDIEGKISSADFRPCNGKYKKASGYIDPKTGKFVNKNYLGVDLNTIDWEKAVLYEIYERGNCIDTKIIKEKW